jgi:hypothetical protein
MRTETDREEINVIKSVNNNNKINERKGKINGKKYINVYIYIYTISRV